MDTAADPVFEASCVEHIEGSGVVWFKMTSLLGPEVFHVGSVVGSSGLVVAALDQKRYPGVEDGVEVLSWMGHWVWVVWFLLRCGLY